MIPSTASAKAYTEFDPAVLEARGIDPATARFFGAEPRFTAGRSRVALEVNGTALGSVMTRFDDDGQLCLDIRLLDQASIAVPSGLPDNANNGSCAQMDEHLPGVQVRLDPGLQRVMLLVPTGLLLEPKSAVRAWQSGGSAGLFNYDALVVTETSPGHSTQYRNLGTELGFNAADWVVRSRQNYNSSAGTERFDLLYTQASRTWEAYAAQVQLGQLNMRSSLFAGESFTGIQIVPDSALAGAVTEDPGSGSVVEGHAPSPARIEVRQSGVVVYSTVVPGGPFALRNLPLLSRHLDLEVTVVAESGERHVFLVPAASLSVPTLSAKPGYGLAAGKIRRMRNDDREAPTFVAANKDWLLGSATGFSAGLLGGGDYRSAGWELQQALGMGAVVSVQQLNSLSVNSGQGREMQAALGLPLGYGLSASINMSRRSAGFRTLAQVGQDIREESDQQAERQWGAAINHSSRDWGAFSGFWSQYAGRGGTQQSRMGATWSKTFSRANLSLNVQRESSGSGMGARGDSAYLTVGFSLGSKRRLSSSARRDERRGLRTGARYAEQLSDTLDYSVGMERTPNGQSDFNARLSALPRYTSVDLGYSRNSVGSSRYDAGLRGGLVLHEAGVTLSPYPVRDTFALVKAGEDAGIQLSTPQGPVWTDGAGRAVASGLSAWRTNRVEIDTRSLPRNVDVTNGYQEVEAGRGAVPRLDFPVDTVRRLMLQVRTPDGVPVPKGASVQDGQGHYLTSVVDAGLVYLTDAPVLVRLRIDAGSGQDCRVEVDAPETANTDKLYATVDAVCESAEGQ
nr:fimbria/pilus outer membrane usher protein [Pseudomonas khorasanensis]